MHHFKSSFVVAITLAICGLFTRSSSGAVLLNTFGPGDSYDLFAAYVISGGSEAFSVFYPFQSLAVQFTPTYDTALDRLTVGTYYYANRDLMRVSLMTNDVDGLPGDVLETFTGSFGQFGSPPFFDSTLHTQLDAGVQYWIAVEAAETDSLGILNGNNLGITQSIAHYAGSAFFGWEHTGDIRVPAMRVEATAIPEPASLGLLGTIGAIALRRGRKN